MTDPLFTEAARLISGADALIIAAGAGMGVDSGLPDFRGNTGFWRAYPALAEARIAFEEIASPDAFVRTPTLAWGFYGHRLNLYRRTRRTRASRCCRQISAALPGGSFVFTSNVDGQFQRAGFDEDRICEVHGSIHHLQCMNGCGEAIVPADDFSPEVDDSACLLRSPCPAAPPAGIDAAQRADVRRLGLARAPHYRPAPAPGNLAPHHGPSGGDRDRCRQPRADGSLVQRDLGEPLIRINPTEPDIPGRGVSLLGRTEKPLASSRGFAHGWPGRFFGFFECFT
jgi:hypothetical protein